MPRGGAVRGDMHAAVFLRLLRGLAGEAARHGIVGRAAADEVHGDGGELKRSPALKKEYFMTVRHAERGLELRLRAVEDLLKRGAAVTHLHHGHAASAVIEYLRPGAGKHALRHDGGTGREVVYPVAHISAPPMAFYNACVYL